ncbi:MAG: hypothetical protein A2X34_02710 [Elusimicrobia bacterium GWC2_51_8]|nr:MAG: hypothetical protein A2X33_03015 [Elusimicrobia bacterium GWA2_51_34]OGR58766.1 MAG: hypothetical protein A2X34_02710 [Elusimicrobia bacterium GWC2_51_8]HAF94985.1 hypothetical protein [Elusimicrobiota bacterium]HCE99093.1 hypothetical protein [Elusimicrobiota bacterium]
MRYKNHILFILTAAVLAGCATPAPSVRHTTPFPYTIALLPLSNQSLDLRAPELLRELLDTYLSAANFNLTDVKEAEEKLRGIGISEGGQLNSATPQKLAALLGADALLYGDIETFNYSNIGVYAGRTVKVRLKLIDAKTGAMLWETEKSKANSRLGLSKAAAKDVFVKGYANKALENIMDNPLRSESEDVVRLLVRALGKARRDW